MHSIFLYTQAIQSDRERGYESEEHRMLMEASALQTGDPSHVRIVPRSARADQSIPQPILVLPYSTRKSTVRPVAASVNWSWTRLEVPSPLLLMT